jgi:hypothetical protein
MQTLTISDTQVVVYDHMDARPLWAAPDEAFTTSKRKRLYKPILDEAFVSTLPAIELDGIRNRDGHDYAEPADEYNQIVQCSSGASKFNLFSSLCEDGLHRLVLDFDCGLADPCEAAALFVDMYGRCVDEPEIVVLVPSTTTGNYHVYIPMEAYTEIEFFGVLEEFLSYGFLEPGYLLSSLARRQTVVRCPWIRKFA